MKTVKIFKAVETSWRERQDRAEVLEKTGAEYKTKKIYFSALMARKYAFLYLLLYKYPSLNKKAWIPDILCHFGWDGIDLESRRRYQHMLYVVIKSFSHDFDLKIDIIRSTPLERKGMGRGFYQYLVISNFGVFNEEKLKTLLLDNKKVFENIIDNNALSSLN